MNDDIQGKKIKIKVEHLRKSFGKNVVLQDLGLTVHGGDVVTIIGPSGSEKTTLLRCLNFASDELHIRLLSPAAY
jgi:ABC-type polar amino acid transport system ATPase subunit